MKKGKRKTAIWIIVIAAVVLVIGVIWFRTTLRDFIEPDINMQVTSTAFEDGGFLPERYTGHGEDVSPPLTLENLVPAAKSIAIIMDDHDFPLGIYNHWVIWNIPATSGSIPEAIPRDTIVASLGNAVQGKSHYGGKHYYQGPLPPFGIHTYVFKVYVLDTMLDLSEESGKADVQKAMEGHILQYGEISCAYGKK